VVKIKRIPQEGLRIQAKMETPHRVTVRAGEKSFRLDTPELLGGSGRGMMPLEAVLGAYAGSLNLVGNFVAKTMDFTLKNWDFTIWAEFDPRGIYGLAKVPKALRVVHLDAKVITPETPRRLAQLRKTLTERCPVHNLLKLSGVRIRENWEIVAPDGSGAKVQKTQKT